MRLASHQPLCLLTAASPVLMRRLHNKLDWLPCLLLMVPILCWVWMAAREPVASVFTGVVPLYVISGRLFTEPFDTVHAGFVMDQPTIGKWLALFTVMSITSLPYSAAVRWLCNRRSRSGFVAFAVAGSVLCIMLLCMLSWPLIWLIQYTWSMGITPRRVYGLLYSSGCAGVVLAFFYLSISRPDKVL